MQLPCYIASTDYSTTETISRLIQKAIPTAKIFRFEDGLDLIESLCKFKKNALIISDYNLHSLNGLQIFKKIRQEEKINCSYCILLVPPGDNELPIKAIQNGADDILVNPFTLDALLLKLRLANNFLNKVFNNEELTTAINELNKRLIREEELLISLIQEFYHYKIENKSFELGRLEEIAKYIAEQLTESEDDIALIYKAAKIAILPKLFLPEKYLNTPVFTDGVVKVQAFELIPSAIDRTFGKFKNLEPILNIIKHINENYDGSGFPKKMKGPEIPLGSRILRVILDFDYFMQRNANNYRKTLDHLWEEMNIIYDFRVIAYFDQFFANENTKYINNRPPSEIKMKPDELRSNMILSRDIFSLSSHKLKSAGTVLNQDIIQKIRSLSSNESILGDIFVRNDSK